MKIQRKLMKRLTEGAELAKKIKEPR